MEIHAVKHGVKGSRAPVLGTVREIGARLELLQIRANQETTRQPAQRVELCIGGGDGEHSLALAPPSKLVGPPRL